LESNWRWLVADLGWSYGPYKLIARVSGAPFGLWIAGKEVPDGTYDVLAMSVSTGMAEVAATVAIPSTHPSFPYGLNVLPD
jgi:hypothetical protein